MLLQRRSHATTAEFGGKVPESEAWSLGFHEQFVLLVVGGRGLLSSSRLDIADTQIKGPHPLR